MLKSVDDYNRQILGLRFKKTTNSIKTEVQEPNVVFYVDSNDHMLQKPMLDKILSLFSEAPQVIFEPPFGPLKTKALFVFGSQDTSPTITYENLYSFQSLSNIAQNNDLKRSLWEKLKKYT